MTGERLMVAGASVLRLAPHIVFRFDETRQRWIMMAPERLMLPDEQAVEILKLVDGKASVDVIVDALAARFPAGDDGRFREIGVAVADLFPAKPEGAVHA